MAFAASTRYGLPEAEARELLGEEKTKLTAVVDSVNDQVCMATRSQSFRSIQRDMQNFLHQAYSPPKIDLNSNIVSPTEYEMQKFDKFSCMRICSPSNGRKIIMPSPNTSHYF